MTEYRIRCTGQGRIHQFHIYLRGPDVYWHRDYLEKQPWTKGCRPFIVEERQADGWQTVGQQELEAG